MAQPKGFEDMNPVAPPPGFSTAAALPAEAASKPPRRVIEPANPEAWIIRVPLLFPLKVDGELLDQIVCRRITGRVLMDILMLARDSDADIRAAAYAEIAGVTQDVLNELEASDLDRVMSAIRPFLPPVLRDDLDVAAAENGATGAGD